MSTTPSVPPCKRTRCLLINPEVRNRSFWHYEIACRLRGAKYPAGPIGLLTVAALLPSDWELVVVDRNVEPLDDALFDWADLVFIGGMITQQQDHLELVDRAKKRGRLVVSGGPDASSSPHLYERSDHLVLGEAEVTLPKFLSDLSRGEAAAVYLQDQPAAMTGSPLPRWDLVHLPNYFYAGLQWSRGCPFHCEFCDIIELFGRVPRPKSEQQVLAELQQLYDLGYRGVIDIVDDNFVGDRKRARVLAAALQRWQVAHGWPYEFAIEASLNLADDPELMQAMQRAGFTAVFVGIETTDQEALLAANKKVNARRNMLQSVRLLQEHGFVVMAGFILGFDQEAPNVADKMIEFIQQSGIPQCMVGLLSALPNTQLSRRLEREGRLRWDGSLTHEMGCDQASAGLNFRTLRDRSEILSDFSRVIESTYSPEAYFERVTMMALALNTKGKHVSVGMKGAWLDAKTFTRMVLAIRKRPWSRTWMKLVVTVLRRNPGAVRYATWYGALYLHFEQYAAYLVQHTRGRIEQDRHAAGPGRVEPESLCRSIPST